MSKLVTIYGGSGFLGRYVARRLASSGWRIRVAVRRPNEAMFVRPYGAVGQVEPVFCNIRDDASVAAAMAGADAVVNCVGTFDMFGPNDVDAVQHEGAARIARLATAAGVSRMVHVSAIGADPDSKCRYFRSKARGEAAVAAAFPGATILRPSVMFGSEDRFFNRFAAFTRLSPVLPLIGANTLFQPVHVDDVAQAAAQAVAGQADAGIYQLGGPDIDSFRGLMQRMLTVIQRRRLVIGLPFWVGRLIGLAGDVMSAFSGHLIGAPVTRDQVRSLQTDSVVADGARGLADLGIVPTAAEAVLPGYLWRFRPSGQFADITASAKNLRQG